MTTTKELIDELEEVYDFWKRVYYPNDRLIKLQRVIEKTIKHLKEEESNAIREIDD